VKNSITYYFYPKSRKIIRKIELKRNAKSSLYIHPKKANTKKIHVTIFSFLSARGFFLSWEKYEIIPAMQIPPKIIKGDPNFPNAVKNPTNRKLTKSEAKTIFDQCQFSISLGPIP
jgi:hypothetical protein